MLFTEDISKIGQCFVDTYGRRVFLGTGDAKLALEFQFERIDKYYYEKWVPKSEVKISEVRENKSTL